MNNSNRVSKMAKTDANKSKKKSASKRVLKRAGRGGRDDDDSSVDSKGNIRNLIDYDYESDESYSSDSSESYQESPRPKRNSLG